MATPPSTPPTPSWSLTSHLLSLSPSSYRSATQAPFLHRAATGRLPKPLLAKWLASDRLYIHAYTQAVGRCLSLVSLPREPPKSYGECAELRLVDWLSDALVGLRREERLFSDVAQRYGFSLDIDSGDEVKGLPLITSLFEECVSVSSFTSATSLPWLESAIVFWGTEKVYLDAWSWAKVQADSAVRTEDGDEDGGALRQEFIPNWTSGEFEQFVDQLGTLIDAAVAEEVRNRGLEAKEEVLQRTVNIFKKLLEAEASFWPLLSTE